MLSGKGRREQQKRPSVFDVPVERRQCKKCTFSFTRYELSDGICVKCQLEENSDFIVRAALKSVESKEKQIATKKKAVLDELTELASYYGYDLRDISNKAPYNQSKGKTWDLIDRRTGRSADTYTSIDGIKDWLNGLKKQSK